MGARGATRVGLQAVLLAVVAAAAGEARGDAGGRAVVVVVEGPRADAVAAALSAHVTAPNQVEDPRAFRTALATRGTKALAPSAANRGRDAQLITRAHAALADAAADDAILVSVRKGKKGFQLHVWAVDAHSAGATVDKEVGVAADATAAAEADAVWAACAGFLPAPEAPTTAVATEPTTPPAPTGPAETPGGTPKTTDEAAAASADTTPNANPSATESAHTRGGALVIVQLSLDAGSRHFSYVDRLTTSLRPYDLFAAPVPSLTAEVYPLARTRIPVLRGLGVTGDYARALALSSADAGGTRVSTSWQSFDVGLRERLDVARAILLGVGVGYGAIDFHFDNPGAAATEVLPSVSYRFLRLGLDVRASLASSFALFGAASYLKVLSTGGEGDLFPRESVGGVDARVGGAFSFGQGFELSAGVGYTRFFYSMNPEPGDANVAGGALDEMARLSLSLAYLL